MISRLFCKRSFSLLTRSLNQNKTLLSKMVTPFSTTTLEKVEKSKQKLSKALSREIKFEEENYQVDETVNKFLKEHGFTFKDVEGDNNMELSKKVGNFNVTVCFQSRSPQFSGEDQEGQEEEGKDHIQKSQEQQEEENQYGDQDYCDFTVYITQPSGKSLAFECTSFDSEMNVNFVSLVSDVEAHKKSSRWDRNFGYSSDFTILDERLQTALVEYLKSFGVNEDLALFVEHVSEDKDRRLYIQWLKDVTDFVERS